MNMKYIIAACVLTVATVLPQARAQEVLTGDTRLACEAILCLATETRPEECAPALKRYFSISLRRLRDTARARANFLNMCPRNNQTSQMTVFLATQQEQSESATDATRTPKAGLDQTQ